MMKTRQMLWMTLVAILVLCASAQADASAQYQTQNAAAVDYTFAYVTDAGHVKRMRCYGTALESVDDWTDIVSIAATMRNTYDYTCYGLTKDGVVKMASLTGETQDTLMKGIVQIAAVGECFLLVTEVGNVICIGDMEMSKKVNPWRNVRSLSVSPKEWDCVVGLLADGTVVSTGLDEMAAITLRYWKDVEHIQCFDSQIVIARMKDGSTKTTIGDQCVDDVYGIYSEESSAEMRGFIEAQRDFKTLFFLEDTLCMLKTDGSIIEQYPEYSTIKEWPNAGVPCVQAVLSSYNYCRFLIYADGSVYSCAYDYINNYVFIPLADDARAETTRAFSAGKEENNQQSAKNVAPEDETDTFPTRNIIAEEDGFIFLGNDGIVYRATNTGRVARCLPEWTDIVSLSAITMEDGTILQLGLTKAGVVKVASQGLTQDLPYADIVQMVSEGEILYLLSKTGVAFCTNTGINGEIAAWKNVRSIAALPFGGYYNDTALAGILEDGSVVSVGLNEDAAAQLAAWRNVEHIQLCSKTLAIGRLRDGSTVTTLEEQEAAERVALEAVKGFRALFFMGDSECALTTDGDILILLPGSQMMPTLPNVGVACTEVVTDSIGNCRALGYADGKLYACEPDGSFTEITELLRSKTTMTFVSKTTVQNVALPAAQNMPNNVIYVDEAEGSAVYINRDDRAVISYSGTLIPGMENVKSIVFHGRLSYRFVLVGLTKDGHIVYRDNISGETKSLASWTDIVDIRLIYDGGLLFLYGLHSNGDIVTTSYQRGQQNGFLDTAYPVERTGADYALRFIPLDMATDYCFPTIKYDGTVSFNTSRFKDPAWSGIVNASGSQNALVGLRADGTVLFTGKADTSALKDIVAVQILDKDTFAVLHTDSTVAVCSEDGIIKTGLNDVLYIAASREGGLVCILKNGQAVGWIKGDNDDALNKLTRTLAFIADASTGITFP